MTDRMTNAQISNLSVLANDLSALLAALGYEETAKLWVDVAKAFKAEREHVIRTRPKEYKSTGQVKPEMTKEKYEKVINALTHVPFDGWIKGKDIKQVFGIDSRMVRMVAEETGEVISTQQGYKLTSYASRKEIRIALADLHSRVSHIIARANLLESKLDDRTDSGSQSTLF